MLAYKVKSRIDKKGNLTIQNLPFKNRDSVEVILLIEEKDVNIQDITNNINKLKASFGTINSSIFISDSDLSRENLYESDGR